MGAHLERHGWTVRCCNWSTAGGELDLVVERAGCLRFVEVKGRQPGDPSGIDAVTPGKQRRLIHAAEAWLAEHDTDADEIAFLLALVTFADPWRVELIDDPFDG